MHDDFISDVATVPPPAGSRIGLVLAGVFAAVVLTTNLPRLDAVLHPVLGKQDIPQASVFRTTGTAIVLASGQHKGERRWIGATLCWERVSFKNYVAAVDNYDVFLDRKNPATGLFDSTRRTFPEIYVEDSGDPIATDEAPGEGWSRRRLCIRLPSKLAPGRPVRLQQFAHFRGLWNMWAMPPTALPEIVSEAATQFPPSP